MLSVLSHTTPCPHIITSRRRQVEGDKAVQQALLAIRGIDRILPVITRDGLLGHVVSRRFSQEAWFRPVDDWSYDCAFINSNSVIDSLGKGKIYTKPWYKTPLTAGIANNWYDLFPVAGIPDAGVYAGAANTAVQWNETTAGRITHGGNVSTDIKYNTKFIGGISANTPTLLMYDRVLTYEANTISNVAQVMDNTLPAQRYISAGELGLQIIVTAQTVLGASASAFTRLRYTDNEGNASQDALYTTGVSNIIVSAAAPTVTLGARVVSPAVSGGTVSLSPFYPLQGTDAGARLIRDCEMSSNNTGTLCFVLAYPLALCPVVAAGAPVHIDQVYQVLASPIIKDGACLEFLSYQPATTANNVWGVLEFVWG